MDYNEMIIGSFTPKMRAMLDGLRGSLITLGVSGGRISLQEPDLVDFQQRLTATSLIPLHTATVFVELTDSSRLGGIPEGKGAFTLSIIGDGVPIATSYDKGSIVQYTQDAGLNALLSKLEEIEALMPEVLIKTRTALGV